jgi:hypothetical protein
METTFYKEEDLAKYLNEEDTSLKKDTGGYGE